MRNSETPKFGLGIYSNNKNGISLKKILRKLALNKIKMNLIRSLKSLKKKMIHFSLIGIQKFLMTNS